MANSISLSTDMKTLYFTDGSTGFTAAFNLANLPNGVYITSIMGDVHVVNASAPLSGGNDDFSIAAIAQWDITFHENTNQAIMIGADDMESSVTAQTNKYDLDKGNTINLRLNSAQTHLLIRK